MCIPPIHGRMAISMKKGKANKTVRPDWEKHQGLPAQHFAVAKANGYDFYATTDHSQEVAFDPTSPDNPAWVATKQQAAAATDANFVALAGYEHSENNGPGGKGHINVFNSSTYLDALEPGIDLPYLYKWLKTVLPNGAGPVVASFNHPGPQQDNNWAYRDPRSRTLLRCWRSLTPTTKSTMRLFWRP